MCRATFTFFFLALFARNLALLLFGAGFILLSKQLHDLLCCYRFYFMSYISFC